MELVIPVTREILEISSLLTIILSPGTSLGKNLRKFIKSFPNLSCCIVQVIPKY